MSARARAAHALSALRFDGWHAARQLARTPLFTGVATLSLAVGIGFTIAAMSAAYATYLKPLSVVDPSSLYRVYTSFDNRYDETFGPSPFATIDNYARTGAFAQLAGVRITRLVVTGGDVPLGGGAFETVSDGFLDMLGIEPFRGRLLSSASGREVVLNYAYWKKHFNADPQIVGKTIRLNGTEVMVAGIGPQSFDGVRLTNREIAGWVGAGLLPVLMPGNAQRIFADSVNEFYLFARLATNVDKTAAGARLHALSASLAQSDPANWRNRRGQPRTISVLTEREARIVAQGTGRTMFVIAVMTGLVLAVLVICCVNVAGMLLSRAVARQHEFTVRMALGASRRRLLAQLLAESALLAAIGGIAGCFVAYWLMSLVSNFAVSTVGVVHPGWRLTAFALATSGGAALLCGIAPILYTMRTDLRSGLGSVQSASPAVHRTRARILAAQVAVSAIVLMIAAASVLGLRRQLATNPGIPVNGLVVGGLSYTAFGGDSARVLDYTRGMMTLVRETPGVMAAGYASYLPVDPSTTVAPVRLPNGELRAGWLQNPVDPEYFQALGIALQRGRLFGPADDSDASRVAVVTEAYAREYAAGVGDYLVTDEGLKAVIIGIVQNVVHHGVKDRPLPTVYIPRAQSPAERYSMEMVVRVRPGEEAAVMHALGKRINERFPDVSAPRLETMDGYIESTVAVNRFVGKVAAALGGVELALAAVGIYGILLFSMLTRTREIGIRLALGARSKQATWAIFRNALLTCAKGLAVGGFVAILPLKLMSLDMPGIRAIDPAVFLIVVGTVSLATALAALVPAWRAAKVEPAVVLRHGN